MVTSSLSPEAKHTSWSVVASERAECSCGCGERLEVGSVPLVASAYRGAGAAPGDVWKAEGRSTAQLRRRVDPCGLSVAPGRSPWCGEPSCFRDSAHRRRR